MSDDQQRPRFGEYAPGHTPGQNEPSSAPESSTPPPPSAPTPWSSPAPGTDGGAGYGTPAAGSTTGPGYSSGSGWAPPVKKRNTVDVVFTIILLVLGLFGALAAIAYGAIFANPELLDQGLRSQGRSGFHGTVGSAPLILILSHSVLYLLAVGLSILSLVKRRITFWIPLAIGVIAAIIFWATVISVLASDPSISQQSGL